MYNTSPLGPNNSHKILYGEVVLTVPPVIFTPRDPWIPLEQSIDSVVDAFNSIDNGSGSFIVTEPRSSSIAFPEASVHNPLSFIFTE